MRCHVETALSRRLGRESIPGLEASASGTFDSALRLRVFLREPGECTALLGETPSPDGAGIPVPAGPWWGVEPATPELDDTGLTEVATMLREKNVPGLHLGELPHVTQRGLSSLAGIESIRWLSFECCWRVPGAEGLPILRSLPGLTDLDLGAQFPLAEEIGALGNLEFLRAPCTGLASEAFEALGASSRLRFLDLGDSPVQDTDLGRLPSLPLLEELHLGKFERTAAALARLDRHPQLRCIGLGDLPLDAAAIASLTRVPRLEHLHDFRYPERAEELHDIRRLEVLRIVDGYPRPGPGELPHLAQLPLLEELDLDGTDIRDGDLACLAGLQGLRCLVLRNTWMTDAGLPHLARLRQIEALDLSLTKVTDAGLACLAGRGNLRWLGLDLCTGVTGRGLTHLPPDSSLADLSAAGSGFDSDGLDVLARLPALRWTNLNRTKVPPEALEEFRRARSGTLLYGDSEPS